ncbi:MAG: GHKL domain-containing protein [Planctomycetes bacterium]|nr:GHKL domain-containing protein [Planctomycetota bacterium]
MSDLENDYSHSVDRILVPIYLHVADCRQKRIVELMMEQEQYRLNAETQNKLDALGQFSAGVAHELNNAIAVIEQASRWLPVMLETFIDNYASDLMDSFNQGLKSKRLTSKQQRERAREIMRNFKLNSNLARKCAHANMQDDDLERLVGNDKSEKQLQKLIEIYEIGALLYNLGVSGEQASAVVESMRNLGNATTTSNNEVDLAESMDRTLSILRNVTKGISIQIDKPEIPIVLLGNKGELVQIWTNLIRNSCEAMRTYGNADPKIQISLKRITGFAEITISDNGPGIPDKDLNKIFQPNFTTKKTGLDFGLGLGLSIVMRIIESYGGQIRTANNPEKGACFIVTFPAS